MNTRPLKGALWGEWDPPPKSGGHDTKKNLLMDSHIFFWGKKKLKPFLKVSKKRGTERVFHLTFFFSKTPNFFGPPQGGQKFSPKRGRALKNIKNFPKKHMCHNKNRLFFPRVGGEKKYLVF